VTKSKFPTDNPQLLGTTVQNVYCPGFVLPSLVYFYLDNAGEPYKSVEVTFISNVIYGSGKTQIFMFWKEFEHVRQHANIKLHHALITATITSGILSHSKH
jgi:hypothetical protein